MSSARFLVKRKKNKTAKKQHFYLFQKVEFKMSRDKMNVKISTKLKQFILITYTNKQSSSRLEW